MGAPVTIISVKMAAEEGMVVFQRGHVSFRNVHDWLDSKGFIVLTFYVQNI